MQSATCICRRGDADGAFAGTGGAATVNLMNDQTIMNIPRPTTGLVVIFDVDGVKYDFPRALGDAASVLTGRGRTEFPPALNWDFFIDWGLTLEEFLNLYERSVLELEMLAHGEPLDGSVGVWQSLRERDVRLHIATDCGTAGAVNESREQRLTWFDTHGFHADEVTFTADKGSVAASYAADGWVVVAVEDRPKNFDALAAAGAVALLRDQAWNRDHTFTAGQRIHQLDEIVATVDAHLS